MHKHPNNITMKMLLIFRFFHYIWFINSKNSMMEFFCENIYLFIYLFICLFVCLFEKNTKNIKIRNTKYKYSS